MSKKNNRMSYKELKEIFIANPNYKKLWLEYKLKHIESRMFGKGIIVGISNYGELILKLDRPYIGKLTVGWTFLGNQDYVMSAYIGAKTRYYYVDALSTNDDIKFI